MYSYTQGESQLPRRFTEKEWKKDVCVQIFRGIDVCISSLRCLQANIYTLVRIELT